MKIKSTRQHKGLKNQADMMSLVLGRMNDADYYVKEAQREREMRDPTILFCMDKESNLYHIKNCASLKDVPEKQLTACQFIPRKSDICPKCYRKALVLHGMNDTNGMIFAYMEFFNTNNVSSSCLKRLSIGNGAKFHITGPKAVSVTVRNQDTFEIDYSEKDQAFLLYHNNYVNDGNERHIVPGYHIENGGFDTLEEVLHKICDYSWENGHWSR